MHKTTGRWQLGFILALCTSILWGLLPIALKILLASMDANTITWYRFLAASACMLIYILVSKKTILFLSTSPSIKWLICIAIIGLTSNFIFYLKGLEYSDPNTTQVVIQLAPMLLLFGGLMLFKEHFDWWQWIGVFVFSIGIVLFFNKELTNIHNLTSEYVIGIMLIVLASFAWAAYALAQKQLLSHISSNQIMLYIFSVGAIVFLPFSDPQQVLKLNQLNYFLLVFCCVNTLLAYGCFAEALNHLEATRVSAILAITPILTIIFNYLVFLCFPAVIELEKVNLISLSGACLIVTGSMLTVFKQEPS